MFVHACDSIRKTGIINNFTAIKATFKAIIRKKIIFKTFISINISKLKHIYIIYAYIYTYFWHYMIDFNLYIQM